jgi:hypothetical protein
MCVSNVALPFQNGLANAMIAALGTPLWKNAKKRRLAPASAPPGAK